jgi:hypothetical protein
MNFAAAYGHAMTHRIDLNVARPKQSGVRCGSARPSSKNHAKASVELADREGFRDVIVRSCIQCGDFVFFTSSDGKNDDRGTRIIFADFSNHLDAIPIRQSQVEHNDVRRERRLVQSF